MQIITLCSYDIKYYFYVWLIVPSHLNTLIKSSTRSSPMNLVWRLTSLLKTISLAFFIFRRILFHYIGILWENVSVNDYFNKMTGEKRMMFLTIERHWLFRNVGMMIVRSPMWRYISLYFLSIELKWRFPCAFLDIESQVGL